jgi:hypothetical protein
MAGIHFTSQEKQHIRRLKPVYSVPSCPCFNTLHLKYTKVGTGFNLPVGGGGETATPDPSCSAKLNLLCKNGPKRKSWKKPWLKKLIKYLDYGPSNLYQVFIWLISSITVFWLVFYRFRRLVNLRIMCQHCVAACGHEYFRLSDNNTCLHCF